jgi:4-amino-4-deoxy-L-arabinose transferase-like glycosyltransferase
LALSIPNAMIDSLPVTHAVNQASASSQAPRKLAFYAGWFLILLCLLANLGAIGLLGPDEPRYAWIARNMAESGDWITPRLYGNPWFEKPILYYWCAGAGFVLHLPGEWAARLPSALAALAAAIALFWLGRKLYDEPTDASARPALLAAILFSSCVGAVSLARAASPDMLFAAALTIAMAAAARALQARGALQAERGAESPDGGGGHLALAVFGGALGLAVLAKGPAALVLACGSVLAWAVATGNMRRAMRLIHPYAIAIFCIVALPWYVVCALRNPEFLRVFILQHNFQRYLTNEFQHRQPFWFFLPIAALALLPWTATLITAARRLLGQWQSKSWITSPSFFFACWAVFPILFFSFSQSKLPGYILPAVPPLALLSGISLARAQGNSTPWINAAIGATWVLMGALAIHATSRLTVEAREDAGHAIIVSAIGSIVLGAIIAALAFVRPRAALWLSFLLVAALVAVAGARVLPALDPYLSARAHGEMLRNDLRPDRLFTYHLQRSWSYGLDFYLHRDLKEWSPTDPEPALVLTTPAGLEEIRRLDRFRGTLDERYRGVLYVPIAPALHH